MQPSAQQIIADRCQQMKATLWQRGRDFNSAPTFAAETIEDDPIPGQQFDYQQLDGIVYAGIKLSMVGEFQQMNAACAIAALQAFTEQRVSKMAIYAGLSRVRFPGRMEVVQTLPTVILDGAHNPDKMRAASSSLPEYARTLLVLALKADKDVDEVLRQALPQADHLIATQFREKGLWFPLSSAEIADAAHAIAPTLSIEVEPDPLLAIHKALSQAQPDDLIWVAGSLYLVGDIRDHWYPGERLIALAETGLSATLTF
jgi:dihydrofolate synthase/folylpolyglutamate synthase